MQTIQITDIKHPTSRQRIGYSQKGSDELRSSIMNDGLFHAIILDQNQTLVAGHNRIKAVESIYRLGLQIKYNGETVPAGHIPYTVTHKTDEVSLFQIELRENLAREQLPPQQEAAAIAQLHKLMGYNAPEILPGLKKKVENREVAQVLVDLKGGPDHANLETETHRVAEAILVEGFKDEPEVKNAKSFDAMVKAARKAAQRAAQELHGLLTAEEQTSGRHNVILGSCVDILPTLDAGTVDIILADPPYGIGADKFGEQSLGHEYEDDEAAWKQVTDSLLRDAWRLTKEQAAMFIFCDVLQWAGLKRDIEQNTDWYVWPTPLIWHKPNRGHAPQPKLGPSRRYEAILYAIKNRREVRKVGSDVLTFSVPDNRLHAAGKPVDLYAELLSWVAYPGDVALDPCAGSGTIIEAGERLDLSTIAIEQNPGFAALCRERAEGRTEEEDNLKALFEGKDNG